MLRVLSCKNRYDANSRMHVRWVVEIRDGKVIGQIEEVTHDGKAAVESKPARVLSNGGRTIRPE